MENNNGKIYTLGKENKKVETLDKLIIVEGPQGVGKSTLTQYLRTNMPGTNLHSLSGHCDKSETGFDSSVAYWNAMLNYLYSTQNVPINEIFDRFFTTEEVYARLGYKEYSFYEEYQRYLEWLNNLNYDITYISLYLSDPELYRERLAGRGSHHNYQAFDKKNSEAQQEKYMEVAYEMMALDNVNVIQLKNDNPVESYKEIDKIIGLEHPKTK